MADEVEVIAPNAGVEVNPVAPQSTTLAEEQPAEALPETEVLSTEAVEPEPEVDLDETPESSGDFDKYKPLFAANPELRAILGREQAFSDIAPNGSFRELKSIVERVPSLEDAETLANDSANHRAMGETFRRDPLGFTESLKENDPFAFQQFAQRLPEILAQTDPALYEQQAKFYSNGVLDHLFTAAQRSGNEQDALAVQMVARQLGVQLGGQRLQPINDNSEVARLRRELAEKNNSDAQGRAESFWDGTQTEHYQTSASEIESMIKTSSPNVTPGQLKRMTSEVWEKVNSRLAQQPQTMAQINQFKASVGKGKTGASDHKAIVDFAMRRTRQLMPIVWKEVSKEWSDQVVATNKEKLDKKKGVTSTAAPVVTSSARQPAAKTGLKKTFGNVFDALRNGTYQKPAARA